jgi:hypothetical protein
MSAGRLYGETTEGRKKKNRVTCPGCIKDIVKSYLVVLRLMCRGLCIAAQPQALNRLWRGRQHHQAAITLQRYAIRDLLRCHIAVYVGVWFAGDACGEECDKVMGLPLSSL